LGAAAWAEWVVDGAAANLIDPRELPSDWLYPFFHLGCGTPWCDDGSTTGTEVHQLDPAMTAAA
jgi:purine nucleoside permease